MTPASEEDRIAAAQRLLGVTFDDRSVLVEALTHPSYAAEHPGGAGYDRLEFLGDSVLGFIVADALYRLHPDQPEGVLTRMKIATVSGRTLGALGRELGIGPLIRMGRGAAATGGREQRSVLENCMEALIGAVFVDQGLPACRELVTRLLGEHLTDTAVPPADPKSALQELVQTDGGEPPHYRIVACDGPPHERVFTAEALVGEHVLGRGVGRTKKAAQSAAALAAIEEIERRTHHA